MSEHLHLTHALMRAVIDGKRPPGDLMPIVLAHLLDLCPTCKAAYDEWQEGALAPTPGTYEVALEQVGAQLSPARVAAERETAREKLQQLLNLPPRRRKEALLATPLEYRLPLLGELLVEESRGAVATNPEEALSLARLAKAVLQHCTPSMWVSELYARTIAHVANALRATGDVTGAAEIFDHARFLLAQQGGGNAFVQAETDCLEASLRHDQRWFEDARRLLERAELVYRSEECFVEVARILIQLGMVYRETDELPHAIQVTREALSLLETEPQARLRFMAQHNLAAWLCEAGAPEESREELERNRPLYEQFNDPLSRIRLAWLEGKIARGIGELQEAEVSLLFARKGFLKLRNPFDAALVSLELAILYLARGELRRVQWLASELVVVFEGHDIHREALAAAILFRDAVELERVSAQLVDELGRYLGRARRDPSYAFQEAS